MIISRRALMTMVAMAEQEDPREACGILLREKGDVDGRVSLWRAENVSPQPWHEYQVDPHSHLQCSDFATLEIVGVFHSHPTTDARPSEFDRNSMVHDYLYVIYSMVEKRFRAWKRTWSGNIIEEQEIIAR